MDLRLLLLVTLAVLENANTEDKSLTDITIEDLPLTKSLGYSFDKTSHNTLEDARLNHEFLEQYQDMLKVSQETYDTVNGEDHIPYRKDGRRQRHAYQVLTPLGRRRVRSEAIRRQKLNGQSLKSHFEHTRQSSLEAHSQETNEYLDS